MRVAAPPDRGLLRWLRVTALTVPAVVFAVLLHAGAHGCVSLQGVAESAVSCFAAGGMLLQREQSLARIVTWLCACQALTHALLQIHCPTGRAAGLSPDARMVTAHLIAALVAVGFLRPAERALWASCRLARAVRRAAAQRLRLPDPAAAPAALISRLVPTSPTDLPSPARTCPPPVRRGPPLAAPLA